MFNKSERSNTESFSVYQIHIAALLWAQYLPGVQPIDFEEINKNSKIREPKHLQMLTIAEKINRQSTVVTNEQAGAFIKALTESISTSEFTKNYDGPSYIEIGDSSSYEPPKIVSDAVKKAGIKCSAMGLFPFKSVMRIYANGSIQFNGKVYCTNPEETHYGEQLNFDNADYMIITGKKFKVFEIPYSEGEMFYDGWVASEDLDLDLREYNPAAPRWVKDKKPNTKYIKIYLDEFQGTEDELLNLNAQEIKVILKDKEQIKAHFKKGMMVHFNEKNELKSSYSSGVGEMDATPLAENFYQETTGVVRVLRAPTKGTIGNYTLTAVEPDDFIISRQGETSLRLLSFARGCDFFEARLCDQDGHILSDVVFKPNQQKLVSKNQKFPGFVLQPNDALLIENNNSTTEDELVLAGTNEEVLEDIEEAARILASVDIETGRTRDLVRMKMEEDDSDDDFVFVPDMSSTTENQGSESSSAPAKVWALKGDFSKYYHSGGPLNRSCEYINASSHPVIKKIFLGGYRDKDFQITAKAVSEAHYSALKQAVINVGFPEPEFSDVDMKMVRVSSADPGVLNCFLNALKNADNTISEIEADICPKVGLTALDPAAMLPTWQHVVPVINQECATSVSKTAQAGTFFNTRQYKEKTQQLEREVRKQTDQSISMLGKRSALEVLMNDESKDVKARALAAGELCNSFFQFNNAERNLLPKLKLLESRLRNELDGGDINSGDGLQDISEPGECRIM